MSEDKNYSEKGLQRIFSKIIKSVSKHTFGNRTIKEYVDSDLADDDHQQYSVDWKVEGVSVLQFEDAKEQMRSKLRDKMASKTFKVVSANGNEMWSNKINIAIAAMHKEETAYIIHQRVDYVFYERSGAESRYVGARQIRLSNHILMSKWWVQ